MGTVIAFLLLFAVCVPAFVPGFAFGVALNKLSRVLVGVNRVDWDTADHGRIWDYVHRMFTILVVVGIIIFLIGGLIIAIVLVPFALWWLDIGMVAGFISACWNKKLVTPFFKQEVNLIHGAGDVLLYAEMTIVRNRYAVQGLLLRNNVRLVTRLVKSELKVFWLRITNGKI